MAQKQASGRRGLGSVIGESPRLRLRPDGGLAEYAIQLRRDGAAHLARLLAGSSEVVAGRVLTVTRERLDRIRVVSDPVPAYERSAGPYYVRGDVLRVTGTATSCNVFLSAIGAERVAADIRAALGEAADWLEFRARVVRFEKTEGPRSLVEIVPDSHIHSLRDDRKLGETGAQLAGDVWTADDFRDWEEAGA
ncbi:MAG: hypothetical protein IT450_22095 [Phycisphaerales bacterium]|nr:hypothetical protein [Phycisphaerales bacterium]